MNSQHPITIAASVKGPHQALEFLVEDLLKLYRVGNIEYGTKGDISWVKCQIFSQGHSDMKRLLDIATAETGLDRETILNWRYKKINVVSARASICFILRVKHSLSYPVLAKLMGAKTHATILLACKCFETVEKETIASSGLEMAYTLCKRNYRKGQRL